MAVSSVLGQAALTQNTNTDLYTVPNGYTARITTLTMARTTTGTGTFPRIRVAIRPNGEALASKHYIIYAYTTAASYDIFNVNIPLASGDVVTVHADQPDATVNIYGDEELI